MYKGWIYKVTCNVNGKVYIGQTTRSINYRWEQHSRNAYKNNNLEFKNKFHRAIRKYGISKFKIEEIIKVTAKNELELKSALDFLEIYYIEKYNSKDNGYNSTYGGDYNPLFNIKGGDHPSAVKINQYSLDGKFIKTWGSISEVKAIYGNSCGNITKVCSKKYPNKVSCKGFIWKYYSDFPNTNDYILTKEDRFHLKINGKSESQLSFNNHNKFKSVLQYDWDGNFLKEFNSLKEAAIAINGNSASISCVCSFKKEQSKGYIWRYKTDNYPTKIFPYNGKYRKK